MKTLMLAALAASMMTGCYHVPVRSGDAALKTEEKADSLQNALEWYAFWPYRLLAGSSSADAAVAPEKKEGTKPAAAASKAESAATAQAAALQSLGGGLKVEKGENGELNVTLPEEALQFAVGSAEVSAAGKAELAKFAAALKGFAGVKYTVQGFTDSKGDAGLNQALSQRRAQAVKDALVAEGVQDGAFVAVQGLGAEQPVGDNATVEGRAKNRRVVVKLKN